MRVKRGVLEAVGRRIAELRESRGFTQEKAAEKLHISVRMMSNIESGENTTLERLALIAQMLDVPLVSLFAAPKSLAPRKRGRPKREG